ncbi:uncharacterized protein FYW61_020239 [Anableps anableps]
MYQSNFSAVNSNFSSSIFSQPSWKKDGLVPAVVFSFCFLLGVPGNIAVIILKPKWEHLSGLSQSLMLNLTVSDLLTLLTLPLLIYNSVLGWTFGLVACKALAYLVYCTVYSSQLTVTALSIQRYLVVVRGRRCHIQKGVLLVLLWLDAVTLCIHAVVMEQLKKEGQWIRCRPHYSSEIEWVAVLVIENLYGLVTFLLVAFSYISLHKKVNRAAFFNNPQTTRLVISIIVSNFILFAPLHVVNVLGVLAISLQNKKLLKFCTDSWSAAKSFTLVNSSLNPLLYAFLSPKICHFFPLYLKDCAFASISYEEHRVGRRQTMDQLNFTAVTSNFSFPGYHLSWYYSGLIPAVVLSFCFVLGVPGNIVVILKPKWRKIFSLSQSLILNLAISDLLCLLTLPPKIYASFFDWKLGLVACKLLNYLLYTSIYSSQLTVTVLGIQRYLQVVHQERWHQEQKRVLLVLLWLVAIILSIPALVVRQVKNIMLEDQQWTICQPQYCSEAQWVAVLLTETLFGFFSVLIVVVAYSRLNRKINHGVFFNNPKTTRLVTSIIVSNFALWAPFVVVNVLGVAAICVKSKGLMKFCSNTWDIAKALTIVIRFPPQEVWYSIVLVPVAVLSSQFLLGVPGNITVVLLKSNWQNMTCLVQFDAESVHF